MPSQNRLQWRGGNLPNTHRPLLKPSPVEEGLRPRAFDAKLSNKLYHLLATRLIAPLETLRKPARTLLVFVNKKIFDCKLH